MKLHIRLIAFFLSTTILSQPVLAPVDPVQAGRSLPDKTSQATSAYLPISMNNPDGGTPNPTEDIHTLSFLVNLSDAAVECTEPEIAAEMYGDSNSVNVAFRESSIGALTVSGDVTTVDIDFATTDGCVREDWATAANAVAQAQGFNLSDYDRLVYFMPLEPLRDVCTWGGNYSPDKQRVWNRRCAQPQVVAHEMGHTLGMYHASTETDEYGDFSDPMGGKIDMLLTQINAPHRAQMGWLPESNIADITASGTYLLDATEIDPDAATNPQILRVKKPDTDEYYYVSFRIGIGLDANLESAYRDTVISVHRFRGFGFAPGYPPPNTYLEALLGDGQSFSDLVNGITITLVSHQAETATIMVEIE